MKGGPDASLPTVKVSEAVDATKWFAGGRIKVSSRAELESGGWVPWREAGLLAWLHLRHSSPNRHRILNESPTLW